MITIGEDYAMVEFEGGDILVGAGSLNKTPCLFLHNSSENIGIIGIGVSVPPPNSLADLDTPVFITFKNEASIDVVIKQLNLVKEKFF